jgi:glycosyltransferase involved in cell wall biosynthesis
MGGVADLERCLDSLDKQTLDIRKANEVWIMVGGHLEPADAELIRTKYPWTKFYQAETDATYLSVKKLGAEIATGEVVLFADSDVAYHPEWVEALMTERAKHAPIDVVASDSRVEVKSSYDLAMTAAWMIRTRKLGGPVVDSKSFPLNNFSIDRKTMAASKYDDGLPLFRGLLGFWQQGLKARGVKFHRIPRVMGFHLTPNGVWEWFHRMLIFGADYVATADFRVMGNGTVVHEPSFLRRAWHAVKWIGYRWAMSVFQPARAVKEDWSRLRFVPLAIPITLASLILVTAGSVITVFNSRFLYDRVVAFENSD